MPFPLNKIIVRKAKNLYFFFNSLVAVIKNGYPAGKMTVIGVTGTDGKTTTAHLIYGILKESDKPAALISTIGAYFENQEIDTGLHTTTPDATVLQPLIRELVEQGAKYLILETTSHGLDQHRVLGCNFKVGVLTNIAHEHLDYHKTFENYQKAKAKLFKKVKIAVLNKDDPSFSFLKRIVGANCQVISYGLKEPADFKLHSFKLTPEGTNFTIKTGLKKFSLKTSLVGDYNLANILAAAAVAKSLKIDWQKIKKAVEKFKTVPGRMEIIDLGQPFTTMVDFAHTPNALEKVLKTLKKIKDKSSRIIIVLGCAGERDLMKRPMMGKIATELADVAILTAEDPRSEKVEAIIDQMAKGAAKDNYLIEPDRKKAISLAVRLAKPNDIVIICGKGHEQSMCFGNQETPWDDRKELRESIKRR